MRLATLICAFGDETAIVFREADHPKRAGVSLCYHCLKRFV
jgi:hypothetical protein